MNSFVNAYDTTRFYPDASLGIYEITEEEMLKNLKQSIESGLMLDEDAGIFIKEGYGALVGGCPSNCSTIDDAIKFTMADYDRKIVGKPTVKEKLTEIMNRDTHLFTDPIFEYKELIEKGYDLVLGPGCVVNGKIWDKAVYCRNYEEILENIKSEGKIR